MVSLLFIIGLMGLFFYNKISSIIPAVDLPTTEIIELILQYIVYKHDLENFSALSNNEITQFLYILFAYWLNYSTHQSIIYNVGVANFLSIVRQLRDSYLNPLDYPFYYISKLKK